MKSVKNISEKWVHAKYTDAMWYHFKAGEVLKVPDNLALDKTKLIVIEDVAEKTELKKEKKKKYKK
jgi:hypothetical protein